MSEINNIQKGYLLLIFLFSPFLGLVNLFRTKDERSFLYFGTLFFGLVGSAYVYVDGSDGHSHLMNAQAHYTDMSLGAFFVKAYEVLTFAATEGTTDLYLHVISYIATSVLQSPPLIHVFAGMVLGYFFSKSALVLMNNHLNANKGFVLIGFIALFLLIKSIGALNSIRMWTGMWVLFYGSYSYATKKQMKYLFVVLFAIIVHFSYIIIVIPLALSYIVQKRKKLLTGIYVLSFFTTLGFSSMQAYIPQSELLENKQKYSVIDSDEKAETFDENATEAKAASANSNFYKSSGETNYLNYSIVGLSVILLLFNLLNKTSIALNFLISAGVGLYAFANFVAFSPALQGRTKTIAATFILAAAIYLQLTITEYVLSARIKKWMNNGFALFLVSAIPMFLFQISYIFQSFSFFLVIMPQISWLLGDNDVSIRNVVGLLID